MCVCMYVCLCLPNNTPELDRGGRFCIDKKIKQEHYLVPRREKIYEILCKDDIVALEPLPPRLERKKARSY